VVDAEYFTSDDNWEDEDHEDADEERPSPWMALFLDGLKAQHITTCLGVVSISVLQELETLSVVALQVRDIEICTGKPHLLLYLSIVAGNSALLITSDRTLSGTGCTPSSQNSRSSGCGDLAWFDPST